MATEHRELHTFTCADIEKLVKFSAKSSIVGHYFVGDFLEQTVRWLPNNSCEVITAFIRGEK